MRVLVTGASGLIGAAVCDALLARGDEVVGLSRDPARASDSNPTVSWHRWDPTAERPSEESLEGVEAVVNLIGERINQRLNEGAKERIAQSRERATKNLVDAITAMPTPPGILVSQSAVGIYGDRGRRSSTSRRRPAPTSSLRSAFAGRRPPPPPPTPASASSSPAPGTSSIPRAVSSSSSCCRSGSGSAARSPAATGTCRGSTATTSWG
jgi:nucleoside-diphosphate-sugar epimerase